MEIQRIHKYTIRVYKAERAGALPPIMAGDIPHPKGIPTNDAVAPKGLAAKMIDKVRSSEGVRS